LETGVSSICSAVITVTDFESSEKSTLRRGEETTTSSSGVWAKDENTTTIDTKALK
jgi:hypothetical protein